MKAELVPYLLRLLERDLKAEHEIDNAAATKAQIVKALKAMSSDFVHGEKVHVLFCYDYYLQEFFVTITHHTIYLYIFSSYKSGIEFLFCFKVNAILDKSPVWSSYKDQKHDLFISDRTTSGYLTGPMGVAGYLTQGTANPSALPNKPPPILTHDDDEYSD